MYSIDYAFKLAPARRPWMSISIVEPAYASSAKSLTIGDDASAR